MFSVISLHIARGVLLSYLLHVGCHVLHVGMSFIAYSVSFLYTFHLECHVLHVGMSYIARGVSFIAFGVSCIACGYVIY